MGLVLDTNPLRWTSKTVKIQFGEWNYANDGESLVELMVVLTFQLGAVSRLGEGVIWPLVARLIHSPERRATRGSASRRAPIEASR